jgi:membrane protein DedA with SNARE-associated domain
VSDISDLLLTGLLNHGNALLGGALFLAALGVPLPATMLLLAAGAFARQGVLPLQAALVTAVAAAVTGDACSYLVGRLAGRHLPKRLQGASSWQRAAGLFARWGSWSVFFSRFLLTPIALPVNLLAGSTRHAWPRFMAAAVAGELLWVLLFGGLGHLFADRWEGISALAGDVVGLLLGAVLAAGGALGFLASRRSGAARDHSGRKSSTER